MPPQMSHNIPQGLLTSTDERGKCRFGGNRGLVEVLAETEDGDADEVGVLDAGESVLLNEPGRRVGRKLDPNSVWLRDGE